MFQKNKYSKSGLVSSNYKQNQNSFPQSLKYHPNLYSKKKSTINKKMSFQSNNNKYTQNQTWKKHNSFNNWNKENDKNYMNYDHHISSKDYDQYYYVPKEKRENRTNYNKEYSHLYSSENSEYNSNNNKNYEKNEKKISIDATTQSNSSSHEELNNNNQYNLNEKNLTVTNENFISNNFQTFYLDEVNNNQNTILALNLNNLNSISNFQIGENNNYNIDSNIENNINNDFEINDDTNNNINYIPRPPIQIQKKNKKQKKIKKICTSSNELNFQKSNSANIEKDFQLNEPYNKFNSANNELITHIINPIVENTEILEVNVKIAKDKNVVFKLRRFDDLFLTVKLFCEINSISEKLMKPIITKALCTLNSIYQIYNTQLDSRNIKILKILKTINSDTSI